MGTHKSLEVSVMVDIDPLVQATAVFIRRKPDVSLRAFISSNVISRILSSWIEETRWEKKRVCKD